MPEVQKPLTIEDLMKFVADSRLDKEEYFCLAMSIKRSDEIWLPDTRWIAVYWVEGGSEGYYVHIDRIDYSKERDNFIVTRLALGKYWAKASAGMAVLLLTPFVYGLSPV